MITRELLTEFLPIAFSRKTAVIGMDSVPLLQHVNCHVREEKAGDTTVSSQYVQPNMFGTGGGEAAGAGDPNSELINQRARLGGKRLMAMMRLAPSRRGWHRH